jgi:iron complex outermembrane receptor protein
MIFYLLVLLSSFPILSQEKTQEIEVVGSKISEKDPARKMPTGFSTKIDLKKISNHYSDLSEVLEKEGGLRIRNYGGLGSYSTLSIRGTNPNQNKVYLDGIPISSAQTGEVNLADLPFDSIDSIEIYRSGSPASFGSSSIGGSINLIPGQSTSGPKTKIKSSYGSFGTKKIQASHKLEIQDFKISLFGLKDSSIQNFPYLNNNNTVYNSIDDFEQRRRNSDFERSSFFYSIDKKYKNTNYRFFQDINQRSNGIPGPSSNQTYFANRSFSRSLYAFTTETKGFIFDNLNLDTKLFQNNSKDKLRDDFSELSFGTPNSRTNLSHQGFLITPTLYLWDGNLIWKSTLGKEKETLSRDFRNNADIRIQEEDGKKRITSTAQTEFQWKLPKTEIKMIPGYHYSEFKDQLESNSNQKRIFHNPRIGGLIPIYYREHIQVDYKFNLSKESRIPSFIELFGERGTILGNSTLVPETSTNLDTGFSVVRKWANFTIQTDSSIYRKNISNMIIFAPNSQYFLKAENLDSATIRGIEINQKIKAPHDISLNLVYNYQRAINNSQNDSTKGNYLPLRPMHQFYGNISKTWGNFQTSIDALFIGANYRDRTNDPSQYQSARTILGAQLSYIYQPSSESDRKFIFTIDIKNITNKKVYDFIGYPLPGRSIYVSLSYHF